MLQERISQLQSNISLICQKLGKSERDITLIAVTKFASAEKIKEALASGLLSFGENKVQEALKKYPGLKMLHPGITLRMIGHLQTNKAKQALEIFDSVDSLDSLKLAEELQKQAEKLNRTVEVLVQVNTSGEEQKYGIEPEEAFALLKEISTLNRLQVKGLMTIAPFSDDPQVIRPAFKRLKELFDEAGQRFAGQANITMKHLSMGMTHDYAIALEEGSNMIRIGTAIFGE